MTRRRNKPYHLRFHGDALGGYELLTLEERGAYTTILDQMYDHGGPVRDDVRNACAWLNCDVRVWKRLRAALVDQHRKLRSYTDERGVSWLVNDRVQTELKLATYAELTANLGDKFPIATEQLSPKSAENRSENNEPTKTENPVCVPLIPSPIPSTPLAPKGDGRLFDDEEPEPEPADEAQAAFDGWNAMARSCGLPVAKSLDEARRRAIRKRLETGGLALWGEALRAVEASAFCRGLRPGSDGRIFKADLTFLCQPKSFNRLVDGGYGQDAEPPRPQVVLVAEDPWRKRVREFAGPNQIWHGLDWGPKPGRQGCEAPAEIQREFGFEPAPPLPLRGAA